MLKQSDGYSKLSCLHTTLLLELTGLRVYINYLESMLPGVVTGLVMDSC